MQFRFQHVIIRRALLNRTQCPDVNAAIVREAQEHFRSAIPAGRHVASLLLWLACTAHGPREAKVTQANAGPVQKYILRLDVTMQHLRTWPLAVTMTLTMQHSAYLLTMTWRRNGTANGSILLLYHVYASSSVVTQRSAHHHGPDEELHKKQARASKCAHTCGNSQAS
jgi:hypothetical protein